MIESLLEDSRSQSWLPTEPCSPTPIPLTSPDIPKSMAKEIEAMDVEIPHLSAIIKTGGIDQERMSLKFLDNGIIDVDQSLPTSHPNSSISRITINWNQFPLFLLSTSVAINLHGHGAGFSLILPPNCRSLGSYRRICRCKRSSIFSNLQ